MSTCTPRSREDLVQMAKAIADLDDKTAAKVLSDARNKPPGAIYWTWVQGLISGIVTHTKYLGANELFALMQHGVETPLAAAIGKIKEVAGAANEGDRYLFGESAAGLWGHIAAVPGATMAAWRAIKNDMNMPSPSEAAAFEMKVQRNRELVAAGGKAEPIATPLQRAIERSGVPSERPIIFTSAGKLGEAGQVLGNILSVPGRSAKGIHTFFRILGEESSLRAQAYRKAVNEGASPTDALATRQADIAANATEAMHDKAVEDGYYGTFMGEMSESAKNFQRWSKNSPIGKWIFPFTHIPRAILDANIERIPGFNMMKQETRDNMLGRNGSAKQDMAIARMTVGSAILGYFAMKYMSGQATGDYPTDPKERDKWELQGKIPNTILVGNHWISTNKFGPAGSIANLGANVGSVINELRTGDDDAMSKAVWLSAETAYHFVGDEVGFQSLANLFDAMHDENKATAVAATTVSSLIPFSSMASQTASIMDPNMRQVKTLLDGLKYRVPGLRETLLPKRDWSGQPVPNPQYESIVRQSHVNTDPVDNEMAALGVHAAPPQDRIKGVKLPPQMYDAYQSVSGPFTRQVLNSFVQQPGWYNLPPGVRAEAFRKAISATREAGAAAIQMRYPELIQAGVETKLAKSVTGEKPPKLKDQP